MKFYILTSERHNAVVIVESAQFCIVSKNGSDADVKKIS